MGKIFNFQKKNIKNSLKCFSNLHTLTINSTDQNYVPPVLGLTMVIQSSFFILE